MICILTVNKKLEKNKNCNVWYNLGLCFLKWCGVDYFLSVTQCDVILYMV